jgi:hypothetical protein
VSFHRFLGADGNWNQINGSWLVGAVGIAAGGTSATNANDAFSNLGPQLNNLGSGITGAASKGHILYRTSNVFGGGQLGWGALAPGADSTILIADSTVAGIGVRWGSAPGGGGNVSFGGAAPALNGIPKFGDTTGNLIVASGFNSVNLLIGDEKTAVGGSSGTPVSASNKLIDESDTRVLPFEGADQTGLEPGDVGLVPAPGTGDWDTNHKFLSADGTWQIISGNWLNGAVQIASGGTSSTNANDAFSNLAPTVGITGAGNKGHLIVRNNSASGGGVLAWDKIAPGTNGQVLRADSTSTYGVKWDDAASAATGSDTEVQFNNGGALGAHQGFRYDDANFRLALGFSGTTVPLRLQPETATPASPLEGDFWYNATTDRPMFRDASGSRTIESTNFKNVASGYAGLDAVAQALTANLRNRRWDLQEHSLQARYDGTFGFHGFGSAPQLAGTHTALADADGRWVTCTSGATAGNACGLETPHFSYVQPRWLPDFVCRIKTPSSLTNAKIWIGFESDVLGDVTSPTGKAIAAFRYINGTDTGWTTYSCDGTVNAESNSNQFAIAAGTVYELRIRIRASDVEFWVNTVQGATDHSTRIPAASQELGYLALNTAGAAASQTLHICRLNLEHS